MEHSPSDLVACGAIILLGFVVIPIWMAMGLADYFCHRRADIEHTAGTRESVLHLLQFGLVGIPLTAALFFRVNAGLLLLIAVFVVMHHAVAYVDVRFANGTRDVRPAEQMVHSFLELLPIAAFLLVATLEFGQLQAVAQLGREPLDLGMRLRNPPLPSWYIVGVLLTGFFVNFSPYVEELIRCVRVGLRKQKSNL